MDGNMIDSKKMSLEEKLEKTISPKVYATFKSVGTFMKSFKSGKLPKVMKMLP